MGVRRKDWVVLGVDLGKKGLIDFPFAEVYESENLDGLVEESQIGKFTVVPDYEEEKYLVAGIVLAHSYDIDGFGGVQAFSTGDNYEKDMIVDFIYDKFEVNVTYSDVKVLVFSRWG